MSIFLRLGIVSLLLFAGIGLSAAPGKRHQKSRTIIREELARQNRVEEQKLNTRDMAEAARLIAAFRMAENRRAEVEKNGMRGLVHAHADHVPEVEMPEEESPLPFISRDTLVVLMKTVSGQGAQVPMGIKNEASKPIIVKPENSREPIVVNPGETYRGRVDAVSTPDGKVFKVSDIYNDSVNINDSGVEIPGSKILNKLMGGGVLDKAPDEGWEMIFDAVEKNTSDNAAAN